MPASGGNVLRSRDMGAYVRLWVSGPYFELALQHGRTGPDM